MLSTFDFTPRIDNDEDLHRTVVAWVDCTTVDPEPREWRVVEADVGGRFREQFEELRARFPLTVSKYAQLVGASRRTLYNWLERGSPPVEAVEALEFLFAWSNRLAHHVSGGELERLLDPEAADSLGGCLARQGPDVAAERAWEIVESASRPRRARMLGALSDDSSGEPPTASAEEIRAALAACSTPRRPSRKPDRSEPPELTH